MSYLSELKELPQWSPSFTKRGKAKAPYFDINKPETYITYEESVARQEKLGTDNSQHIGIMPSLDDPYVFIDVDIDPDPENIRKHCELTPQLIDLLNRFPTYTEWSPSGLGLHIIFKLSARDHESVKALKLSRITSATQANPITGELMFSSSFLIITEASYFDEQQPIRELSLENLLLFFPTLKRQLANPSKESNVIGIRSRQRLSSAPDINDMRDRLLKLPAEMNFYVERAYNQLIVPMQPNTYEHWVMIAMCLSHAAILTQDQVLMDEYYLLFDEWSQSDPKAYVGPDDTLAKWEQCLSSTTKKMQTEGDYQPALTKSTLHKLVNLCYPSFTVRDNKGAPVWQNTKNLEAVLNFHDMKFQADAYNFDSLYVECHQDVADRVFNPTFIRHATKANKVMVHLKDIDLSIRKVLEASAYPAPVIARCLRSVQGTALQEVNFDTGKNVHDKFKTFIDETPWDKKPRVQDVISTLHFDPYSPPETINHYRNGLYKCLLWLAAIRYHGKPASAPTVPILVGSEGIYKSTWVKSLLHETPFALQYVKQISGLMSDRKELSRALQSTLIALIDEIETKLKNADSVKDVLTEETLSLRAHYTNNYVNVMKRGLIFGTTNNPYMNASEDGNRRLFRITVQQCDTDALWKIDMQQVFAELKHDYFESVKKGVLMPWVFTKKENEMNNLIMGYAATASEDSMLLHEFFGGAPTDFEFNMDDLTGTGKGCKQSAKLLKEGHVTTVRKLTNELVSYLQEQNFNVAVRPPNTAVIRRKLQSFAAKYTRSEHKTIIVGRDTQLLNGMITLKRQTLFVVPLRKEQKNDKNA